MDINRAGLSSKTAVHIPPGPGGLGPKTYGIFLLFCYDISMKTFKRFLGLATVLALAYTPLHAQWKPVVEGVVKSTSGQAVVRLTSAAPKAAARVPSAASAAAGNLARQTAAVSQPHAMSVPPAAQPAPKAMSDQAKRNYYAVMTKLAGMNQRKALEKLYKRGAKPTYYPMPKLSEESFAVAKLEAAHPSDVNHLPAYPFTSPRALYRGINVSSTDLQKILTYGLRSRDSGEHHSDFQIFNYPSKELMEMFRESCPEDTKSICLISDPARAAGYSLRDLEGTDRVPIVIQVNPAIPTTANPVAAGVIAAEDVPLSQIRRVSALLEIEGPPRWGDISITPQKSFIFHPYLPFE